MIGLLLMGYIPITSELVFYFAAFTICSLSIHLLYADSLFFMIKEALIIDILQIKGMITFKNNVNIVIS